MESISTFITLAILFGVMYFLLIRPQKRRMAEQARLVASLEVGDEVLTSAGIFGKIRRMNDDRLELETAGGTRLEILKSAVVRRIGDEGRAEKRAVEGGKQNYRGRLEGDKQPDDSIE